MLCNVVIVDDSKAVHGLVAASLADDGYTLKHAFDGMSGLAMVEATVPDLVLLDVDMPDINGFEVCKRIKANANLATVGVVFLTACSSPADRIRGLELASTDYILKPFEPRELSLRVRSALCTMRMVKLLDKLGLRDCGQDSPIGGIPKLNLGELLRFRSENPWDRSPPVQSAESARSV